MAGAKSLFVLCFLLVIATSHAANCRHSICYQGCRQIFSRELCAEKCGCSLSTFVPDELGRKVKMPEALASKMEEVHNRAEAVLSAEEEEEMMMMMEELISLNDRLTSKCKYQPCYRLCRAVGGSKDFCAKKCNCTQLTQVLAGSKDMKDADDEESATN